MIQLHLRLTLALPSSLRYFYLAIFFARLRCICFNCKYSWKIIFLQLLYTLSAVNSVNSFVNLTSESPIKANSFVETSAKSFPSLSASLDVPCSVTFCVIVAYEQKSTSVDSVRFCRLLLRSRTLFIRTCFLSDVLRVLLSRLKFREELQQSYLQDHPPFFPRACFLFFFFSSICLFFSISLIWGCSFERFSWSFCDNVIVLSSFIVSFPLASTRSFRQ